VDLSEQAQVKAPIPRMNKEAAPFFKLSLLIFNLSTSLESGEKSGSFHGFWPGDDQRLLGFGV
jgi:hypothetical protein